jgi:hypothetical protein
MRDIADEAGRLEYGIDVLGRKASGKGQDHDGSAEQTDFARDTPPAQLVRQRTERPQNRFARHTQYDVSGVRLRGLLSQARRPVDGTRRVDPGLVVDFAANAFMSFAVLYMKQPIKLDCLWAALCLVGAVYFVFRG